MCVVILAEYSAWFDKCKKKLKYSCAGRSISENLDEVDHDDLLSCFLQVRRLKDLLEKAIDQLKEDADISCVYKKAVAWTKVLESLISRFGCDADSVADWLVEGRLSADEAKRYV